ncbi:hypothetical protein [Nodosilinea sp. P-1105]|uniref:hypothetical protein n=1 Tax=Nodosilinea sp. P-1105 TaxID=2546229 RepID=UPI00146B061E|nr:hypothetical protein [Nodosilinea sp. P-1105]NMF84236.1 hypothetical protein [Nodosilinea sp. P-1105]
MADPLFWLALSLLLVAVSLTAVLMVAIPAMRELSRAARSAEKLFDTLGRELPPTLEAIRLTGLELTELTDELNDGIHQAGQVVKQVDQGFTSARQQAKAVNTGTKSAWAGARAAWRAWTKTTPSPKPKPKNLGHRPSTLPTPRATQGNQPGLNSPASSLPTPAPDQSQLRSPSVPSQPPNPETDADPQPRPLD